MGTLFADGDEVNGATDPEPAPDLWVMMADECERFLDLLDEDDLREIALLRLEGYSVPEIARRASSGKRRSLWVRFRIRHRARPRGSKIAVKALTTHCSAIAATRWARIRRRFPEELSRYESAIEPATRRIAGRPP